jgi:hypothetical protein
MRRAGVPAEPGRISDLAVLILPENLIRRKTLIERER